MVKALKLWWLNYQIKHLENKEAELKEALRYLQIKILPHYRTRRNDIIH